MKLKHLIISSTSSVYGDYKETFKKFIRFDNPLSFYVTKNHPNFVPIHIHIYLKCQLQYLIFLVYEFGKT